MATRSKSKVRIGCMMKRFGEERVTLLSIRRDHNGTTVARVRRHIDGAEVEEWWSTLVHALACPCRKAEVPHA